MAINFINKKTNRGDGSSLNLFVQLLEPELKKGIWFNKEGQIDNVCYDDSYSPIEQWLPDGTCSDIPRDFMQGVAVSINNDIYIIGGGGITATYKYDTQKNTYTRLANSPCELKKVSAVAVGTDIYIFGNPSSGTIYQYKSWKYSIKNNTFTEIAFPYPLYECSAAAVGTDIYIFGDYVSTYRKTITKYNTLTGSFSTLGTNIPYPFYGGSAVAIGTDIYLLGGNGGVRYNYKYNTKNGSFTQLSDIPFDFRYSSAVAAGTDIYILGSTTADCSQKAYKYNTLTNTYTALDNIPYAFAYGVAINILDKIYLLGGQTVSTKIQVLQTGIKEENTVIISQKTPTAYETELFSNTKNEGSPKFEFTDTWYFGNSIDNSIPVYYGNGTEWIKIKN